MKIGVRIMPKNEVLDSQGRAVERLLNNMGKSVLDCRVGKFVELNLKAESKKDAEQKAREIAEFILFNPLIETYDIEFLE